MTNVFDRLTQPSAELYDAVQRALQRSDLTSQQRAPLLIYHLIEQRNLKHAPNEVIRARETLAELPPEPLAHD